MKRGLKPHDCVIGITVPLSREQFLNDLKPEVLKDFAKCRARRFKLKPEALWSVDYESMVQLVQELASELHDMGVSVLTNFTLADLPKIAGKDVFTLVAHWDEERSMVELNDRMVSTDMLVDAVPDDFKGIFDLTVCHSVTLQTTIKKKFRNLVIANERAASVEYRLINYKYCMKYIRDQDCTYVDAVTEIRKNILPTTL